MDIEYREIAAGSAEHAQEHRLRDAVLRRPLGRTLSAADIAQDAEGRHFAAIVDGELVGCVGFYPEAPGVVKLRHMAVSPDLQGQGVGAALVALGEDWARANGFARIVTKARTSALGFYERLGYTAEGDEFIEVSIPHKAMWKAL